MIETLKNGTERAMTILKAEYDKKISELQLQCKEDITKIDMLRKEALAKADS